MLIDFLLAVGRHVDRLFGYRPRGSWPVLQEAGPLRIEAERADGTAFTPLVLGARLSEQEANDIAERDAVVLSYDSSRLGTVDPDAISIELPADLRPHWCAWHQRMTDVPGGVTVIDDAGGQRWCCASCLAQRYVVGELRTLPIEQRRTTVINEPDCAGDDCLMGHTYTAACAYSHRWRQKDAPLTALQAEQRGILDVPCPHDPDGLHHVGCGCEA